MSDDTNTPNTPDEAPAVNIHVDGQRRISYPLAIGENVNIYVDMAANAHALGEQALREVEDAQRPPIAPITEER